MHVVHEHSVLMFVNIVLRLNGWSVSIVGLQRKIQRKVHKCKFYVLLVVIILFFLFCYHILSLVLQIVVVLQCTCYATKNMKNCTVFSNAGSWQKSSHTHWPFTTCI